MNSAQRPILLVEDNPMDVDLTLRAFRRGGLGRPVQVARDGEEALAWMPRWDRGETLPVVILMDIKLPRLSGLDVLEAFKAHPEYRLLPVVLLTTSNEERDVRRAYELGANSYIVKPVTFETFVGVAGCIDAYWCRIHQPCDPRTPAGARE